MRKGSIVVALLTLVGGSSAWAQAHGGAVGGGSTAGGVGTPGAGGIGGTGGTVVRGATRSPTSPTAAAAGTGNIVNNDANTPPPPLSITSRTENLGVPPTPAPAFPGLPSSTAIGALPSDRGFSAQTQNELRPAASLNAAQVSVVQASLAAGGLFRGPIDGNMTASTRASIRQFQQASGLPETGELDAQTMTLLARTSSTGASGANGNTSTTGNRAAAGDPFATTFTGIPSTAIPGAQTGPIFSQPFPLSNPINTSPSPPFMQP